jgi:hypothetical protein
MWDNNNSCANKIANNVILLDSQVITKKQPSIYWSRNTRRCEHCKNSKFVNMACYNDMQYKKFRLICDIVFAYNSLNL